MSGKTTLLRIIAGELEPTGGAVDRHAEIEYLAQCYEESLFPWKSVLWNIAMPLIIKDSTACEADLCEQVLGSFPLFDELRSVGHCRPPELSGGMQHLLASARALASGASVILLDEPFTGLDPCHARLLSCSLQCYVAASNNSRLIIVVSHERETVLQPDFVFNIPPDKPVRTLLQGD
jgi:ABC-type nitrate/sulfonate/bicarbonate transport system ATPase subunit